MPRNVEIKARVDDLQALHERAAALAGHEPTEIRQDDTFFRCPAGRLKLREFADGTGELIFYQRTDQAGPKQSFYVRSPVADPRSLRECLEQAYGIVGRVRKTRWLYLAGRTRIHLDRVEGLGDFIELEVVLNDDEPLAAGEQEARSLMEKLGIEEAQLVEAAYVDLLR
jgi:predicted adenylyl cyclase CyaB